MKRTINFTIRGQRVRIEFETEQSYRQPKDYYMSLTGRCRYSSGQCQDSILKDGADFPEIVRICALWNEYHMKKPTKKAVAAITKALDALDGKRFGPAPDVDELPKIDPDADTLYSMDIIEAIEGHREALMRLGVDPETDPEKFDPASRADGDNVLDLLKEFAALSEVETICNYGDWEYGMTLVNEDYFEDFAREEAESLGLVKDDAEWPARHIDWSAAADELKSDYGEVFVKGHKFYVRN